MIIKNSSQNDLNRAIQIKSDIALSVSLISFGMLFATLFMGVIFYRTSQPEWPPMGLQKLSLLYPNISLFVIILSSLAFYVACKVGVSRKIKKNLLTTTFLLGLAFLGCQFLIWHDMKTQGLYASVGIFPSLILGLTWVHFGHVLLGLICLVFMLLHEYFGIFEKSYQILEKWTSGFWHFLTLMWGIIFISLFI